MQKLFNVTLKYEQLGSKSVKYLSTYTGVYIKVVVQFMRYLLD